MTHILFVINKASCVISHRLPLVKEALKKGWKVSIAAPNMTENKEFKALQLDVDLYDIELERSGINPFKEIKSLYALWKLFKEINPSIIHAVTVKPSFYSGLVGRFFQKIHQICMINGVGYLFSDPGFIAKTLRILLFPLIRFAFSKKKAVVLFQNPDDQNLLIQNKFVSKKQCRLIRGSGVDMDQYAFSPLPKNNPPLILMPSRLLKSKGVFEFVEAAKQLKESNIPVRMVLAGGLELNNPSGIHLATVQSWVNDQYVEWLGECKDMPALYRQSDIVCLPSYREGLPKALLEAASVGRPIITTDVPGCRETIIHDQNGYLVPIQDANAIANSIQTLLKDKEKQESFGKTGREMVEKHFSNQIVVKQTFDLYDELFLI